MMRTWKTRLWAAPVLAALLLAGATASVGASPLFQASDPAGDDKGPGTYTYPTNAVFVPQAFDLVAVTAEDAGDQVIFRIRMAAPITNPWGGPNGMSVQMFHIYVDRDHRAGSGFTDAIPGANVAFAEDEAWDRSILIEGGWGTEVEDLLKDLVFDDMREAIHISHEAKVEGDTVIVPVSKAFLGQPQAGWGFQVVVLGQEGSKDVMDGVKVRRVLKASEEWRFGGSDESGVHPNALDILTPPGVDQYTVLKAYDVAGGMYAVIPMLYQK